MGRVKRRMVIIVGRPNVGKSAIFNRLVGRRIAIVHAESGVTRDRLIQEVSWAKTRFELVDTGGFIGTQPARMKRQQSVLGNDAGSLEEAIRAQVQIGLEEAAAALLVVDVESGLHPLDREVAALVHTAGLPAVVAANKADNKERDAWATEFAELGFPVFPVSALHNRGFAALLQALLPNLPDEPLPSSSTALRVAIVGRPNVGKSSYINRLLDSDRLVISPYPGTTRDSVDIPFHVTSGSVTRHYVLIDTAGLRPFRKIRLPVERFSVLRAEHSIQRADVVVHILDATTGPTHQDKHIANLVRRHQKACALFLNKWDLASGYTQKECSAAVYARMPFTAYCPLLFISAKTGYHIAKSIAVVDRVGAHARTKLPTGILNRVVIEATQKVLLPSSGGRALRVFYCTQVATAPPRIRIFVNDPRLAHRAFEAYVIRALREKIGLEGTPIILEFRSRPR